MAGGFKLMEEKNRLDRVTSGNGLLNIKVRVSFLLLGTEPLMVCLGG